MGKLVLVLSVFVLVSFDGPANMSVPLAEAAGDHDREEKFEAYAAGLYKACELKDKLDYAVFRLVLIGYLNMKGSQLLLDKEIITVIDYTESANDKRFFVVDLAERVLLYHTLVAHGKNTGNEYAKHFSNRPKTQKSSLGFYITGETYYGKHGFSLKLDGIDSLYNDNARIRQIIIHGAHYVSDAWAKKYGRIGRSWGCPALPEGKTKEIIDIIKNGCCLFVYFDDTEYLASSKYLKITEDILNGMIGEE